MIAVIIILVILVILAAAYISIRNGIIEKENRIDNAWETIEVQLQRRNDLIPNLVETVKGYAPHESATLEAVVAARANMTAATTPEARMEAANNLSGALQRLLAVAESYPDLKANANFINLQNQLSETEDKISYMRQSYNDVVMKFNTAIQSFPAVLIAGPLGFTKFASYDADIAAERAPQVQF